MRPRANAHRHPTPQELHTLLLGVLIFKIECRDVSLSAAVEHVDRIGAQTSRSICRIDGGITCANHNDRAVYLPDVSGLVSSDQFERIHHPGLIFAVNAQPLHRAEADTEKNVIELRLERAQSLRRIDGSAKLKFNSQAADQFHFVQAFGSPKLVFSNTIRIEASRKRAAFENRDRRTLTAQLGSACERRRTRTNTGDPQITLSIGRNGQPFSRCVKRVHRVPLQQRDLYGIAIVTMHNASTLAKYLHRASARATATQDVGIENAESRAAKISAGDALDESRHVDVRWTSGGARRIETVEAAICLKQRSLRFERRLQFAESRSQLRIVR